jgi:hypothetical protein
MQEGGLYLSPPQPPLSGFGALKRSLYENLKAREGLGRPPQKYSPPVPATPTRPLSCLEELLKNRSPLSFINEPGLDAESPPENKRKGHLVSGAFISPYRAYAKFSVVFFGRRPPKAGGGPMLRRGGAPPKYLSSFRRFLIANDN